MSSMNNLPSTSTSTVQPTAATTMMAPSVPFAPAPLDMNEMVVFCADKAGMSTAESHVTKTQINQVIYDMSVGSAHFKNAQQRNQKVDERIEKMKRSIHEARNKPPHLLQAARTQTARKIHELEANRPLARNWLHIDMDAFYASVEIRDRPELANKPVAVGGMSMISTSNYIARQFGVRSAMPGFIAIKLCPNLVFVPHNFEKYTEVAKQTREIFAEYDPNYEAGSLDEAYLDITDYVRREARRRRQMLDPSHPHLAKRLKLSLASDYVKPELAAAAAADDSIEQEDEKDDEPLPSDDSLTPAEITANAQLASEIAAEIRRRVFERTKLTCSGGLGCNRMIAKIATDFGKPNGQFMVDSSTDAILRFMAELSVRKIPGIGKVMEKILHAMDISTCEQLRDPEFARIIYEIFSLDTANWLISVSLGLASNQHSSEEDSKRKSISTERTFREISSWHDLETKLHQIAENLAKDIQHAKCHGGKTVTLKIKTVGFEVFTRAITLDRYVSSKEDLIKYGTILMKEECDRLIALHAPGKQFKTTSASPSTHSSTVSSPHKQPPTATNATITNSPIASTQSTTTAAPAVTSSLTHPPNPRDGVLKLRLMGLRLSALKEDTAEVSVPGNKSILSFVKTGVEMKPQPPPDSASTSSATKKESSSTSSKHYPTDADISSFFAVDDSDDVMMVDASSSSITRKSPTVMSTLDRFFAKNPTPPSHSSATQPTHSKSTAAASLNPSPTTHSTDLTFNDHLDDDTAFDMLDENQTEEAAPWFQEFMSQPDQDKKGDTLDEKAPSEMKPTDSIPHPLTVHDSRTPTTIASTTSISSVPTSSTTSSLICPVCSIDLGNEVGNLELNKHIDACLNGKTIHPSNTTKANNNNKRKHGSSLPTTSTPMKGIQTLDQILSKHKKSTRTSNTTNAAEPIHLD